MDIEYLFWADNAGKTYIYQNQSDYFVTFSE